MKAILMIDGLDYRTALKLPSLRQEAHGVISLKEYMQRYGRVHSLEVWYSFLTGEMPRERLSWYSVNWFYLPLTYILKKLKRHPPRALMNLRKYLILNSELFKYYKPINVIFTRECVKQLIEVEEAFDKHGLKRYLDASIKHFEETREMIFDALSEGKQFIAYIRVLDSLQHARQKLMFAKNVLAIAKLSRRIRENGYKLLIVSDHGFHGADHSKHSF